VVAKRKQDEATTSYTIDRQALDNQQMLNIGDISTLLPGGKTVNPTLMNDNRLALRSGASEKGNASFGTAVEIDGIRLDNNAANGETTGASTRTISTSNIESVEVVTGIPSVEYGDLSNGVVKVNTRKGKSPFIIESSLTQHTNQWAMNKGFELGGQNGVINVSLEHAKSFSNAASPHTAYQRNILSLHYMGTFMRESTPITLNFGITGNIGGYNSESDPDEIKEDYSKARDNAIRTYFNMQWLLNKTWITNLQMNGTFAYCDRKTENKTYTSSASTQPYIHTTEEGYYMAQQEVEKAGSGNGRTSEGGILLSPTGYWYVTGGNDSKPMTWALKVKADWNHHFGDIVNRFSTGIQYTGSKNQGRGTYYTDMAVAPTWREYRYDELPAMNNLGLYAENKTIVPTTKRASLELTAGIRDDITMIRGSDYGTIGSLSPRINGRYIFWRNQYQRAVHHLEIHTGWGKSVKLPSQQVLYPAPAYTDREVFASTSDANNISYRAYHTTPTKALYNAALRWQYTNQTDLGIELDCKGTRLALSAFYHSTHRSYMSKNIFTPFEYQYTPTANYDGIPLENRKFSIDKATGVVTMSDATNAMSPMVLDGIRRKTYAVSTIYDNADTPIKRYGLEWIVDFAQIKPLRTNIRLDGNYYIYKGLDEVLFADVPLGVNTYQSDGQLYQYVGYYRGSNVTGTSVSANAYVSNGSISRQLNQNLTMTTHIPKIRMIMALRIESTLYNYHRQLSELSNGTRGYMPSTEEGIEGEPYDGSSVNKYVVVYPEYYTTWENPTEMIPFAEKLSWAKDHDPALYSDLAKLVVRSNYAYTLNPNRLSAYFSANLSVTKEIGDHISLSFYANNFFNTMRHVHSSQTNLDTSLFDSNYVPNYYYGLSLRLKI
jgi:outer membrane receptor protein involved in Fe transport